MRSSGASEETGILDFLRVPNEDLSLLMGATVAQMQ